MDTIQVTRADQGEYWLVGSDVFTIKASGRDTSGNLLIMDVTVLAGGGLLVLHRHVSAETFLLLEGEFEVRTSDTNGVPGTVRVTAGDTVSVPSMVWHNFKNVGATPGKFVAIHSPAAMEAFVREIGQPIDDPHDPPEPAGPSIGWGTGQDDGDHPEVHGGIATRQNAKIGSEREELADGCGSQTRRTRARATGAVEGSARAPSALLVGPSTRSSGLCFGAWRHKP